MSSSQALVKIHLYSGRRNPEWLLSEKDTGEFLRLCQQAKSSSKKYKPVSKLGYAGCLLFINEKKFFVYDGLAVLFEGDKVVMLKDDKDHLMEKLLISFAPEEVKEKVTIQ